MFTATIKQIGQNTTGDIVGVVQYTNGLVTINETIEPEANASTVKETIQNRLNQLQAASDFVQANPISTQISGVSDTTTVSIVNSILKAGPLTLQ